MLGQREAGGADVIIHIVPPNLETLNVMFREKDKCMKVPE